MTSVSRFSIDRRECIGLLAGGLALGSVAAPRAFAQAANLSSIKIATIGAGREGGALGTLFAKIGHPVMFSSRHPDELKGLVAAAGPTARAGTVADAVAFGEVIFLVVPYTAVEQIGRDFGTALAAKALILDVSNPIARRRVARDDRPSAGRAGRNSDCGRRCQSDRLGKPPDPGSRLRTGSHR